MPKLVLTGFSGFDYIPSRAELSMRLESAARRRLLPDYPHFSLRMADRFHDGDFSALGRPFGILSAPADAQRVILKFVPRSLYRMAGSICMPFDLCASVAME
jgi:hypothetical protein